MSDAKDESQATCRHCRRMARNGSSTHPDLREPDWDDADMIAASEDAEPKESSE